MGLLSHKMLQIVKGVGPTPGDTASAEQPLIAIDLLDSGNGISLDLEDGWEPNIPSLKNGGVWADSPISDGRTLMAGVNTNVTETMRLIISAQSAQVYAAQFAALQRNIQDGRAFWDTSYQIEPVYIAWWASGAPGPQYALIFNIDMDLVLGDSETATATITLTIEREEGWRGVRPGGSPKEWTYYKRGQAFNSTVAALNSGTDHLVNATIQNRREWNAGQTVLTSQNYFDVPADSVPGDLDALCLMSFTMTVASLADVYFGRSTKPDLPVSGVNRKPAYILNAGDLSLGGADTTTAADTGAPISTGAAVNTRGVVSFASTPGDAFRFSWTGGARGLFDPSSLRGRFLAFARARLSAASTVTLHLQDGAVAYPTATLTGVGGGGVGNTTGWEVVYLGVVTFPKTDERIIVGNNGLGASVSTGTDFQLGLYAARIGAAVSLYVADVILIPMDECIGRLSTTVTASNNFIMDNTGHLLHGKPGEIARAGTTFETIEQKGDLLTLKPNVNNRVIFFGVGQGASVITPVYTVRLDIVPRWSGIRDA